MKKLVFACLLGMGILLPSEKVKSNIVNRLHRVVDVNISGWVLYATSQTEDGTISKIEVYRVSTQELVLQKNCSGYSCDADVSALARGLYVVKVSCQYVTYSEQFTL